MVVVGPDGVGKSGLARALLEMAPVESHYFHFRPVLGKPLPTSVPIDDAPAKTQDEPSMVLGWLRLGLALIRFWEGYLAKIRPAVRRGALVVGDRWAYGYVVQPRALRYGGPRWLATFMLRLFPSPDLVVNLTAPPVEIHRRKQELTVAEIEAELQAWDRIPARRSMKIDALETSSEMAARILTVLDL